MLGSPPYRAYAWRERAKALTRTLAVVGSGDLSSWLSIPSRWEGRCAASRRFPEPCPVLEVCRTRSAPEPAAPLTFLPSGLCLLLQQLLILPCIDKMLRLLLVLGQHGSHKARISARCPLSPQPGASWCTQEKTTAKHQSPEVSSLGN